MVFEASNSLYFRRGAEKKIAQYDFLADCETLEDREVREGEKSRIREYGLVMDRCFPKMLEALGIKQVYCSTHEGTAFKRELFDQMLEIYDRYYLFDLNEIRYGREDLYLSTLARHFSAHYSNRLTVFIRHDIPSDEALKILQQYMAVPDDSPSIIFALKPVPRLIDNPVRQYINALP